MLSRGSKEALSRSEEFNQLSNHVIYGPYQNGLWLNRTDSRLYFGRSVLRDLKRDVPLTAVRYSHDCLEAFFCGHYHRDMSPTFFVDYLKEVTGNTSYLTRKTLRRLRGIEPCHPFV